MRTKLPIAIGITGIILLFVGIIVVQSNLHQRQITEQQRVYDETITFFTNTIDNYSRQLRYGRSQQQQVDTNILGTTCNTFQTWEVCDLLIKETPVTYGTQQVPPQYSTSTYVYHVSENGEQTLLYELITKPCNNGSWEIVGNELHIEQMTSPCEASAQYTKSRFDTEGNLIAQVRYSKPTTFNLNGKLANTYFEAQLEFTPHETCKSLGRSIGSDSDIPTTTVTGITIFTYDTTAPVPFGWSRDTIHTSRDPLSFPNSASYTAFETPLDIPCARAYPDTIGTPGFTNIQFSNEAITFTIGSSEVETSIVPNGTGVMVQ